VTIVGGGPAGLMAAEVLAAGGASVDLFDAMPSVGRKFLLAGKGGLNLTHAEPGEAFVRRYGEQAQRVGSWLQVWSPQAVRDWADGLGAATFVGSSGKVFPHEMKAAPLLRAWLQRLRRAGVRFHMRHRWLPESLAPSSDGPVGLRFATPSGEQSVQTDALLLALGGASWAKLGSDAAWVPALEREGVAVAPFRAANCGFDVGWSGVFRERFAGEPLKNVRLSHGGASARGDAMVAGYGLEGGAVYALGGAARDAALAGGATLTVDLRPDIPVETLERRLLAPRGGQSLANFLRKALKLSPVEVNLLREAHGLDLPAEPAVLAAAIKAAPLAVTGVQPLDRAISAAGGVRFEGLDGLSLKGRPNVILAGEMLDWEAPTGGYLLQACFATGAAAGRAALGRLG